MKWYRVNWYRRILADYREGVRQRVMRENVDLLEAEIRNLQFRIIVLRGSENMQKLMTGIMQKANPWLAAIPRGPLSKEPDGQS